MKKSIFYLTLFLNVLITLSSFAQNYEWAKSFRIANPNLYDKLIAVDANGNVYTTGYFEGTVDFDPGVGTFNMTSSGYNAFVCKLDVNGNLVWAKKFGDSSFGNSITVDATGNVYTTGTFISSVDFDPSDAGTFTLTAGTSSDGFISKLDASGNFVWAKQIDGNSFVDIKSIALDANGNVYTAGHFSNSTDFDPSNAGTYTLSSAGGVDIFVSKLDVSGNFVWAKQMGGTVGDIVASIAIDADGNVFTTGYTDGTADFDPSVANTHYLSSCMFISKLDVAGNFVWAKGIASTSFAYPSSIVVDAAGDVYTTGKHGGTTDFNPASGIAYNLTASGADIFVSKLNNAGNFMWAKNIGGSSNEVSNSMALDASANVYLTGGFVGTVDFDPSVAGTYTLTSNVNEDIFISKLSSLGDFIWAKSMTASTTWTEYGKSIVVSAGNIYTTGYFEGTVDFDPTDEIHTITENNNGSMFISKLSNCTTVAGTTTINACTSYTWINGVTYTTPTTTATYSLTNLTGCDSLVTLNLTINSLPNPTITQNNADLSCSVSGANYEWFLNGASISGATTQTHTATSNGTYTIKVTDANTCVATSPAVIVTTVGINKNTNEKNSLVVFPNPAKNTLTISFAINTEELQIIDVLGKVVAEQNSLKNTTETSFDISNLKNGVYFVKNGTQTVKFIKE